MKIIFLDHQGVMHLEKYNSNGIYNNLFDKNCIHILNSILEKDNDIEIVISSDWKVWISIDEMRRFYKIQGILKEPLSYTKKTVMYNSKDRLAYAKVRADEIKLWIEENSEIFKVTHWIAVDDLDMTNLLSNFAYVTEIEKGISQNGIKDKILLYLSDTNKLKIKY